MTILEVSFRDMEGNKIIERSIREKVRKLVEAFPGVGCCRITLEEQRKLQRPGKRYRIHIAMTLSEREFVAARESKESEIHELLARFLTDTFSRARRVLREHTKRSREGIETASDTQPRAGRETIPPEGTRFPGDDGRGETGCHA